jgi:hypothetical protein
MSAFFVPDQLRLVVKKCPVALVDLMMVCCMALSYSFALFFLNVV